MAIVAFFRMTMIFVASRLSASMINIFSCLDFYLEVLLFGDSSEPAFAYQDCDIRG